VRPAHEKPQGKLTDEQVSRFTTMYHAGASWLAMGAELDMDPSWLAVLRKRIGIPERKVMCSRVNWTDEMNAELRRLFPTTKSHAIGRKLGISKDAVESQLRRLGMERVAVVPVDTYTGSPAWFRAQFGSDPLPPMHPLAREVLGLSA